MKRTNLRINVCCVLLTLILLFIWGNSALPAELSDGFSDWVRDLLNRIFPGEGGEAVGGTHLLRKMAHFLEFASLGACLCWLAGMLGKEKACLVGIPVLGGFGVACLDEAIQYFVPGRNASFLDVGIDTAGVAAGTLLLLAGYFINKFINNRRCSK